MAFDLILTLALAIGQTDSPPPENPAPPIMMATPPERWPLMMALQGTYPGWLLDGNRMRVNGWVDVTYVGSTAMNQNLPLAFDYRANEVTMQQAWFRWERTVDQTASMPTIGFRTDSLIGTDYRFTVARGLFDSQLTQNNGEPNLYGADIVQFYAEAYIPDIGRGLDVKIGRFYCQFGAQNIEAPQNVFVSHSYNFLINPYTHTGVLTTLKLTDTWSIQNGLVAGCDVFLNSASNPTYIGSVKWAPPNGPDNVQLSVVFGSGEYDEQESFQNPNIVDINFNHKFNERMNYTLDASYGFMRNVPNIGFANWWAITQYLGYTLSSQWSAHGRFELADDAQGVRTGYEGLYTEITAGFNYRPNQFVVFRPEVRYDYNGESRPFEGKHDLLTAAIDVIVRW